MRPAIYKGTDKMKASIVDITTDHIASVFFIRVKGENRAGRTEIALEAVDLATHKGKELADAIREATGRAIIQVRAALCDDAAPSNSLAAHEDEPLVHIEEPPSNVTSINQSGWKCARDKQVKILKLWNTVLSLGITELELREVLKGYGTTTRKDLNDVQADGLIAWLAETINSILDKKRAAR